MGTNKQNIYLRNNSDIFYLIIKNYNYQIIFYNIT